MPERVLKQIEGEQASGSLIAPSKTPPPDFLEDFCCFLKTIRTRKSYVNDSYQSVQRFVKRLRATTPLPFRRMPEVA